MIIYLITLILGSLIINVNTIGIIGIFSSPENFLQRHTIRSTWLKEVNLYTNIRYKFVIGNQQCKIPLKNRINIYECEEKLNVRSNFLFSTAKLLFKKRAAQCASGFGFLANDNFYITHIGIPKQFIELYDFPLRVKLTDASSGRQVSSVTFYDKDIHLKAINPVYFPRGSEGVFVLDKGDSKFCFPLINNITENILTISSIVHKNLVVPVEPHYGLSIYFDGRVEGDRSSNNRNEKFDELLSYKNLRAEQTSFNDILFVNVTDVYRNLPVKLIKFLEKITAYNFSYVIKIDDDSMLDIKRIEYYLPYGLSQRLWWWSAFKEFWAVPRFGKWREKVYKSVTYPPFPCGGGYVLSKDVVEYITIMKDNLKLFQGEDVSIGIWLSGLKMHYYCPKNELYQAFRYRTIMSKQCEDSCSWTCNEAYSHKPTCNLVQLTPIQMVQKWKAYLKNGYLK